MFNEKLRDEGMSEVGLGIIKIAEGHGIDAATIDSAAECDDHDAKQAVLDSWEAAQIDMCDAITSSLNECMGAECKENTIQGMVIQLCDEQLQNPLLIEAYEEIGDILKKRGVLHERVNTMQSLQPQTH